METNLGLSLKRNKMKSKKFQICREIQYQIWIQTTNSIRDKTQCRVTSLITDQNHNQIEFQVRNQILDQLKETTK